MQHVDSITAVLVFANGTVPRITVGTANALSVLSAILPKASTKKIAFVYTNASSPLHWNFSRDTLPDVLKDAPQFLLDSPVALQKKYRKLREDPTMTTRMLGFRKEVQAGEQDAWEMLVHLFNWFDGLGPQTMTETVPLYEELPIVTEIHTPVAQNATRKAQHLAVSSLSGARILCSLGTRIPWARRRTNAVGS